MLSAFVISTEKFNKFCFNKVYFFNIYSILPLNNWLYANKLRIYQKL